MATKAQELKFQALYFSAHTAGLAAVKATQPTPMVVSQHRNPLDDNSPVVAQSVVPMGVCGFATIEVHPGNCAFANWLKKYNIARKNYHAGGVTVSVPHTVTGQSYELKVAYANAFAAVLRNNGYDRVYVEDRLD